MPAPSIFQQALRYAAIVGFALLMFGRFRWAACCLDQISKCRSDASVRNALVSLPRTLEETYERMLCSIPNEDKPLAIRVFQWLVARCGGTTLNHVLEILAVEIDQRWLDLDNRLNDAQDLVEICGGLVTLDERSNQVGFAHFTVYECLTSAAITKGKAAVYHIDGKAASVEIAKISLTYCLYTDFEVGPCASDDDLRERCEKFPFLTYAVEHGLQHLKGYKYGTDHTVDNLMLAFFGLSDDSGTILSWMQIFGGGEAMGKNRSQRYLDSKNVHPNMLYYVSWMGICQAVKIKLARGDPVNVMGGHWFCLGETATPLKAASASGHAEIVKLLLEHGADPNIGCTGGQHHALVRASARGDANTVRELLRIGAADYGPEHGKYEWSLSQAMVGRSDEVATLLIEAKAEDGPPRPKHLRECFFEFSHAGFDNTCYMMIGRWREEILTDVDECFTYALRSAAEFGHIKWMNRMLRVEGVKEFCCRDGVYQKVLQGTVMANHENMIDLLISLKDREHVGKQMGVSLHLAAVRGFDKTVKRLLAVGADPLQTDHDGWTPITQAYQCLKDSALEILLKAADITEIPKFEGSGPVAWVVDETSGVEFGRDELELIYGEVRVTTYPGQEVSGNPSSEFVIRTDFFAIYLRIPVSGYFLSGTSTTVLKIPKLT